VPSGARTSSSGGQPAARIPVASSSFSRERST